MKWWQFFFLMAAIHLAPLTPAPVAMGLGAVVAIAGFLALLRDD